MKIEIHLRSGKIMTITNATKAPTKILRNADPIIIKAGNETTFVNPRWIEIIKEIEEVV